MEYSKNRTIAMPLISKFLWIWMPHCDTSLWWSESRRGVVVSLAVVQAADPRFKSRWQHTFTTVIGSLIRVTCLQSWLVNSLICRLGRRKAVLIGIIGECVAGVVLAFSPDIYSVGIFRFIMGVATSLMFLPAFVMGERHQVSSAAVKTVFSLLSAMFTWLTYS